MGARNALILGFLFDFDSSAGSCKIGFDLFSVFLGNAFFERLRNSLNKLFGFFESKTGDLTNRFDNAELAVAEGCKDDVKFGFLFCCGSSCTADCGYGDRSCGNAELLFESLYKVSDLKNGKRFDFIKNSSNFSDAMIILPPLNMN